MSASLSLENPYYFKQNRKASVVRPGGLPLGEALKLQKFWAAGHILLLAPPPVPPPPPLRKGIETVPVLAERGEHRLQGCSPQGCGPSQTRGSRAGTRWDKEVPFKDKGTEGAHGCQELHLPRMKAPATLRSAALRESTPSGARSSSFAEEFKIRILLQTLPRSKCWEIIKHFSTLSELNKTHRGGRGGRCRWSPGGLGFMGQKISFYVQSKQKNIC